ncbi:putative quinol monooxygenase [Streptomyces griseoloalbus]|uniref:Quinol monooxygenase n=1 Tax=Streptomyces griseoloalbus TaxID=67303 RepID=A0ABV3EDD0_9ACTN
MHDTTLSAVGFARARRDRAAELGDILVAVAERSRTEEGCLESLVHRDLADPDLFVCYERWASEEAVARHLAQPYLEEFLDRLRDCLEQDLIVHRLSLAGPAPAPVASEVRDVRDGPTEPDDPTTPGR